MDFGQALDDAGELLTLLGLLAVIPVVFVMTRNIGNPEFDMIGAFEMVMYGIIDALMPVILATLVVAGILWVLADEDW